MLSRAVLRIDRTEPAAVVVIVDDSRSMELPSRAEIGKKPKASSRFEAVAAVLPETQFEGPVRLILPAAGTVVDVALPIEAAAEFVKAAPTGEQTRLGEWVLQTLNDASVRPRAIVLFSDGVNTSGPGLESAAEELHRQHVPLFCVGPDGAEVPPGLAISDLLAPDVVFPGDPVVFQATLDVVGLKGKRVRVQLTRAGVSKPVDERELTIDRDGSQTVRLVARPEKSGAIKYAVSASVPEGSAAMNPVPLTHVVQVRSQPIRVLLAAGSPNFEYRFLNSLLSREESISTRVFLFGADPLWGRQHPDALERFPASRDALAEYDVIVLDDVSAEALSPPAPKQLAAAVRNAGKGDAGKGPSLVVVAGSKSSLESFRGTALESILPVRLDTLRDPPESVPAAGTGIQVTPLGLSFGPMQVGDTSTDSQATWENAAPIYGFVAARDVRPGAASLLVTSSGSGLEETSWPLIVTQPVGAGRVWLQATDESWRWRAVQGDSSTAPYARYWIQLLRYLALSRFQKPEMTETSAETPTGRPDRETSPELAVTVQDTSTLKRAAETTGGRFVPLDRADILSDILPRPRESVVGTEARMPLWNAWYVLLVLFLLLGAEWLIRRRNRLI